MDPMNPQGGDQGQQPDPGMGMPSSSSDDTGMDPNPVGGGGQPQEGGGQPWQAPSEQPAEAPAGEQPAEAPAEGTEDTNGGTAV